MYDNDYIVLIDENGQPYIAHAKFIDKIKTAAGKFRYFYDADELKAYYENLRNTASNAARNTVNRVQTVATNTRNTVNRTARNAKEKARDVLGYDEFDRYERALDRTAAAKQRAEANPNSAYAQTEKDRAEAAEARAHDEYLHTPLGRSRDAISRVKEAASDVKEKAKEASKKVKDIISKCADTALDSIGSITKDIAANVKSITNKYGSITLSSINSIYSNIANILRNDPPTPRLSPEGVETIIPEKVITENIDRGTFITENILEEAHVDPRAVKELTIDEIWRG